MRTRLLLLIALAAIPCAAANPPWINIGPPGGGAWSLVNDAKLDTAFVVNPRSGVFRSVRGGPWTLVFDAQARSVTVRRAAVDAQTSRIYAGTSGGLFRSDDEGATWSSVLDGSIVEVAASGDRVAASTSNQLFRSSTAGSSWAAIDEPPSTPSPSTVTMLRFEPTPEEQLLAVIQGSLFLSTDLGTTWTLMAPKNIVGAWFGDFLYLGGASGAWRCDTTCDAISSDNVVDITQWQGTLYEATSDTVFHIDEALHRIGLIAGFPQAATLSLAPTAAALLAGTTAGIVQSTDGATWSDRNEGFDNVHITALMKTATGSIVAATLEEGLVREQNGSWSAGTAGLPGAPPTAPGTRSLAGDGTTLFAAFPDDGLFRSIDDGRTWQDISAALPTKFVVDVAGGSGVAVAATVVGPFRSANHGVTWQRFASYPAASSSAIAMLGQTIAVASGTTAFISTDSGTSWSSSDLPALIRHFAVAGARVYALTDRGFFVHAQNVWSAALLNGVQPNAIAADGSRLYVSNSSGIEFSDDAVTWTHVVASESLPADVTSVAADGGILYVGTDGGSLFRAPATPRRRAVMP